MKTETPVKGADGDGGGRRRLAATFWGAVGLSIALSLTPYGRYVLYPFALLCTWAHEMGHGLTAWVLGGKFRKLELYSDLGGVAFTAETHDALRGPLVSAGGLLGPALLGGLVVVLGAREVTARRVLLLLSVLLTASLVLWVRNVFGCLAVFGLAVGMGWMALRASDLMRLVVAQMVGIQLCLGSIGDVDYMFTRDFERGGVRVNSDTQNIAEHLLLPYWVWGAIICALSLAILVTAFWVAWLRPSRRAPAAPAASPTKTAPPVVGPPPT